jgi:hypothetical protein
VNTAGAQPVIDYLTKDYAGFRQGMLNQIPLLLPQWTDRSEADFGVVLIELMAYVADILSYYQDRVANEAFLASATQRRSVADLLRLIDYQIDPAWQRRRSSISTSRLTSVVTGAAAVSVEDGRRSRPARRHVRSHRSVRAAALNNAIDLAGACLTPAGSTRLVVPRASHALAEGHVVYFEQRHGHRRHDPIRRSPPLDTDRRSRCRSRQATKSDGCRRFRNRSPSSDKLEGNNVVRPTAPRSATSRSSSAMARPGSHSRCRAFRSRIFCVRSHRRAGARSRRSSSSGRRALGARGQLDREPACRHALHDGRSTRTIT